MTGGARCNELPIVCAPMTAATLPGALRVITEFLTADPHYLASSAAYGATDASTTARALDLFLARPELGFVWIAQRGDEVVAACVACYAISTTRGGLVIKLDDVSVLPDHLGQGIGTAMLDALKAHLRALAVSRIDIGCHRDNDGAWRFYERHGFVPLDEERLACVL
jgi:GNAT superfamily N-acetyltransferase